MKYKRKEIDRAGFALIGDEPFERQQAMELVTDWRKSHLPVLRELNEELTALLSKHGISFEFSSQRIKRMQSIVEKIRNNKEGNMGLGGLHDIGGIRFVFPDTITLEKVETVILSYVPQHFTLKKIYDYISSPKVSGYRSIHYVYKYHSENQELDGLQIELQIRTTIQHSWAMAVETASLISGTSLKASLQDGSVWRGFFKLVCAIFSKLEDKAVLPGYEHYSDEQLYQEYFSYSNKHKLVDTLRALRVDVDFEGYKLAGDCCCVLVIDFINKRVKIKYFDSKEEVLASELFSKIEHSITSKEAALMVSMKKIEKLQKAYPSYFLDTEMFIEVLNEFEEKCKLDFLKHK